MKKHEGLVQKKKCQLQGVSTGVAIWTMDSKRGKSLLTGSRVFQVPISPASVYWKADFEYIGLILVVLDPHDA